MRESKAERAAWTAVIDGKPVAKGHKYNAERCGHYASKREAKMGNDLAALYKAGVIRELREQVRYVLVPAAGGVRSISYVADFVYKDGDGFTHVCDVKGFKTPVYILKRKMMQLLLGITVEEL